MRHNFIETDDFTEDMTFGEIIKKKRRLLGMNQADFGDYIGNYHTQTISGWELGNASPPYEEARRIINYLGGDFKFVNSYNRENPNKRGNREYRIGLMRE